MMSMSSAYGEGLGFALIIFLVWTTEKIFNMFRDAMISLADKRRKS
jgi:hypothetical protein